MNIRNALALGLLLAPALSACGNADVGLDADSAEAQASQALLDEPAGDDVTEGAGEGDVVIEEGDAADAADVDDDDCAPGALRRRVITRYDADGSGELESTERQELRDDLSDRGPRARLAAHRQVRRALVQRLVWIYDADNSGGLDDAERSVLKDDLQARCEVRRAQRLARYDVDGSGELSADERAQARADRADRITARRAEIKDRLDRNGDGRVDAAERAAAVQALRARGDARREALRAEFDVDGSGDLDADEQAALRAALQARVRLDDEA